MSVIARYLFRSRPTDRDGLFDRCQNVVDHWAGEVRGGRPAGTADWLPDRAAGHRLAVLRAATSTIEVGVGLAETAGRVSVFVELRNPGPAARLGTLPATPQCVRGLLAIADAGWEVGDEPYAPSPTVFTTKTVGRLKACILSKSRLTPLVVAAQSGFRRELPGRLASELGGLAAVAVVDEAAAAKLTTDLTRAWGCFDGAVRVYWPGEAGKLWLRKEPADQTVAGVRDAVMRWTAANVAPPEAIVPPRPTGTVYRRADAGMNPRNRGWVGEKRAKSAAKPLARPAAADGTPTSPIEAVEMARERFAKYLVFGADADADTNRLAKRAGPPDKILHVLGLVADLTKLRRAKKLKVTPLEWLRQNGADVSPESDTTRNSARGQARRTWDFGDGTKVVFDDHVKPSHGNRSKSVRIYYAWCQTRRVYVIGYVGPHL